jgi:hypothetical protein
MTDYIADVRKYAATADEAIVNKIVRHLGIALRNKDSSLVSCSDPEELKRVRDSWCKKKLGLTDDAAADAAIKSVCETMKGDRTKSRVTFYYLCADKLGKLGGL